MVAAASPPKKPRFPGYILPLNFDPWISGKDGAGKPDPKEEGKKLFRTALDDGTIYLDYHDPCDRMPMLTSRETAMLTFVNRVTDKEDWETKVFDASITLKLKTEILEQGNDFTPAMADYYLQEFKYKAEVYQKTGAINLFHGDVVKSDRAIPRDALKAGVYPLENVPDDLIDWHPGSDDIVPDLVHPSLYPLIYGVSRIITSEKLDLKMCLSMSGVGKIVAIPPQEETGEARYFQWLSCDVDISGETPKIVSYINNLHPQKHRELYNVLEKIIGSVIPLWDETLTPLRRFDFKRRVVMATLDYGDFETSSGQKDPS